jgi:hypothetical protein
MTSTNIPDLALIADYLERYRNGVDAVLHALDGAASDDLDRKSATPGAWCARQVVHHLADSETNSYVRLRRLLAEPDGTAISGYDEAHWADVLAYDRPIDSSLAVFVSVRNSCIELLDALVPTLSPEVWSKAGQHSESGAYTLLDWLRIYAEHGEAHADQIVRAREGS